MDFLQRLAARTSWAVLLRYGLAILGAMVVTAGYVSQTQFDSIAEGITTIAGVISTIAPVIYAVWKARQPQVPIKDISPELRPTVAEDVAANRQSSERAPRPRLGERIKEMLPGLGSSR